MAQEVATAATCVKKPKPQLIHQGGCSRGCFLSSVHPPALGHALTQRPCNDFCLRTKIPSCFQPQKQAPHSVILCVTDDLPYIKCPLHVVLKLSPVAYGKPTNYATFSCFLLEP